MNDFHGGSHHKAPVEDRARLLPRLADTVVHALCSLPADTCLVGAGISGGLVVPSVADAVGRPFTLIRERGSRTAAADMGRFVGVLTQHALFIDDCIYSGNTVRRVQRLLLSKRSTIVGIVVHMERHEYDPYPVSKRHLVPLWRSWLPKDERERRKDV